MRAFHLKELSDLFVQVVTQGTVAIDGTKVKANASRHKAMAAKLKTGEGQAARRKRKGIAEPPKG